MKPIFGAMMSATCFGAILLSGCSHPQPVNMAPPLSSAQQMGQQSMAPPVDQGYQQAGAGQQAAGGQQPGSVYQWQDVPQGQQVPITRATFDQGGYQIFASSGETIVVPFVNQNLYALKFGRTSGQPYFVNDGSAPVLYMQPGGFLENAAAQNTRWYPIPNNYAYTQPMYVSVAPSWSDYMAMGWYPGMNYYGGMWGYNPYRTAWMPGFYVSIGGSRYSSYNSYHTYYTHNPGFVRTTTVYRNYSAPRGTTFGSSRASGGGSFGTGRRSTFGSSASTSSGSFGTGRTTRSFGGTTSGSGFGAARASGNSFGASRPAGGSSFGGSRNAGGSSFGGSRPSGGSSFGGSRSSGSSFGGSRSSGGSFGRRR